MPDNPASSGGEGWSVFPLGNEVAVGQACFDALAKLIRGQTHSPGSGHSNMHA